MFDMDPLNVGIKELSQTSVLFGIVYTQRMYLSELSGDTFPQLP